LPAWGRGTRTSAAPLCGYSRRRGNVIDLVTERLRNSEMMEDANAILRKVRCSAAVVSRHDPRDPVVSDLVQAVGELDDHLCQGGAPPEEWSISYYSSG
jgi:hypothetical protein